MAAGQAPARAPGAVQEVEQSLATATSPAISDGVGSFTLVTTSALLDHLFGDFAIPPTAS
jgi:hypothetical protein